MPGSNTSSVSMHESGAKPFHADKLETAARSAGWRDIGP